MHAYQVRPNYFDFWAISRRQLEESGVQPDHIDVAGLCTRCNQQFFSYRRASALQGGITGRNGSVIGLPALGTSKS
jgi:polyphenol oxidase